MGKPSKNQLKSTGGQKDCQVKYSDPRMAFSSTKKDMVVKESEIPMNLIFGNDIPCANAVVVVAEDHLGYYLTSKSYVGVSILDPYRNYKRDEYTIAKQDDKFVISVKDTNYEI